jgi:hypothetical protein
MIDRESTASGAPRPREASEDPRPGEASASPAAARDFYIGYQAQAPTALGRFHRRLAGALILAAAAFGAGLAGLMHPLPPAHFEFGQLRSFEGWISERPFPSLLVLRPGQATGQAAQLSRYLLVAEGKHGAQEQVSGLDGRRVRIEGTLAWRGSQALIEVAEAGVQSLEEASDKGPSSEAADLEGTASGEPVALDPSPLEPAVARGEELRLQGEIVGAKCFLGVMNPGESTVHRDCAALCIRGGVPALFVLRDRQGREQSFVLVDEDGLAHGNEILPLVGLPLTLKGRAATQAGLDFFFVSRDSIQELAAGQAPRATAFEAAVGAQGFVCDLRQ